MSALTATDRAAQAQAVAANPQRLAEKIEVPVAHWVGRCHEVSLALVKSGEFGPDARVARGWALGIASQHSWIVLGNPYDPDVVIIDATNPAYHQRGHAIKVAPHQNGRMYVPQGWGELSEQEREGLAHIMPSFTGPQVELSPRRPLSENAAEFLAEIGPMDYRRWCWLATMVPVGGGWPAKEIIEAMVDSGLGSCVPADVQGMVTDRNPWGLYMQEGAAK